MIIGITGGIGSGKSIIARELARRGFAVYDCDREAKRIIAENEHVQAQIIALLGDKAFTDGAYNTAYVAQRVFAEPKLLEALNHIIHPAVTEDIQQSAVSSQQSAVLFVESAILFEAGLDALCDKIIIVDAPEDVRVARVIERDYQGAATEEHINKVRARMERQKAEGSSQQSDKKNTIVLMNDGTYSISALADQIIAFL